MAPLAELSVNLPGKTKQTNLNGISINSGKRQPPSLWPESNASSLPTASAIQSMLKNTTELGDVGLFAAKPTKLPRHSTGTAPHPQKQHYYQPRGPYADYATGNHITQKRYYRTRYDQRGYPLRHNPSLRTNGGHSLISDSQDQRSDSVTQSSINSRRISVHPSLPNIRPYARVGPRPRSPYTYPSRLKRPGYRPFSPGFSEANVSDSALHSSVHRAYSTRTESPTSSMRKMPQAWNHGFNRSDPLLQYYPALPLSRRHDRNRSPPFLRRPALPGSPLASHRSSLTGKPRVPKASDSSSSGELAASSAPLFYDYSEAFEKESFNHTAQRSSMFESRYIPQSDGSSEGYQADVTNTSTTSTKCSGSSTESKAITPDRTSVKGKRPSPLKFVSRVLKQQPVERNKASVDVSSESSISSEVVINPSDDPTLTKDLAKNNVPSNEAGELLTAESNMADPFSKSSAKHNGLQRPPSTYNPAPKVFKAAAVTMRLSSSSSGSQYSSSAHSRPDKGSDPSSIKAPEVAYERQPKALSVSFNRLEMVRQELGGGEPQRRAASLDTHSRPEPCQIFAPVPERSMSSRDSRDRFSRILSFGEDFGKQDLFTSTLSSKKAPITIQQYLRDRKPPVQKIKASTTKELPPLPDDPPPVSSKGKEKEVDEPHGDHQATEQPVNAGQALRQDADVYSITSLEHVSALTGFGRPGIPPRYSSISRNSLLDPPESSQSFRASIVSQKPGNVEQPRRFSLTPRNSSLFQTMKELPPLPKEAVVSIALLPTPNPLDLPCSSASLMPEERLDAVVVDIEDSPKEESPQPKYVVDTEAEVDQQTPTRKLMVGYRSEQGSNASPASARPWNLDASYPWAGTPPKLEVSIPQPIKDPAPQIEKLPRFRLNVRRPSVLGTGGKFLKSRPANIKVVPSSAAGRKTAPRHTRFTEGFDNIEDGPPSIALMPPSPGLQIEAQSFFSDDSSQKHQKGSLRRRFSQIRGAIRAASSDDGQPLDRSNASSASGATRATKGSGKRSSNVPDDHGPHKFSNWKLLEKIKSWLHCREEKIKKWRRKLRPRNPHVRAPGAHCNNGV
ncbi:MAG: hypothetical protein Q9225_004464 [Loekoesia sp. 1 TL-2023]